MSDIYFNWTVSDFTGWGNYGLNLILNAPPDRRPIPLVPKPVFSHPIDPFSTALMAEMTRRGEAATAPKAGDILLAFLGNPVSAREARPDCLAVGVIFAEMKPLPDDDIGRLRQYDRIITGSNWSQQYLVEAGIDARLVIQGVNTELHRPLSRRYLKDRFIVFSGGKLEHRKGQDIVLKAFSHFAKRHPEALLVTAWRSPFEGLATNINTSGLCKPLVPAEDMPRATRDWILANGVPRSQFMQLDIVPNFMMPEVYREVDLAVFTNRAEAGTNLVAMEALSCGVPCLISNNTGHKDIIFPDNCIPLEKQGAVSVAGQTNQDWGESSVDEVVGHMEDVHSGQRRLDRTAIRRSMEGFTWKAAIDSLFKELDLLEAAGRKPVPVEDAAAGPRGISRNALCPCGSGKRFKHCHGLAA